MKKIILTICLFASLASNAHPPAFEFVKQIGDSASDNGKAIARHAAGNLYVAGSFGKTVDFDPGTGVFNLTSALGMENYQNYKL